jgi:hypothetical protein
VGRVWGTYPDFYNQPDAEGCWLVEESLPTSGQRMQRRSPRLLPIQPVFLPLLPPCLYVDESGCDKRTGWSPLGTTPVQIARYQREQRWQILPAYTQDGILLSRVFQGTTDSAVFEDYIKQLLQHCGRWPEPNSVLVMDNASFHHTERIAQMCVDVGVKLMYLRHAVHAWLCESPGALRRLWSLAL